MQNWLQDQATLRSRHTRCTKQAGSTTQGQAIPVKYEAPAQTHTLPHTLIMVLGLFAARSSNEKGWGTVGENGLDGVERPLR